MPSIRFDASAFNDMQLRYDEDLVEAAVLLCANGGRKAGPIFRSEAVQPFVPYATKGRTPPAAQIARFHREREKVYSVLDPDERNAAFFKLYVDWFREWGLEKLLIDLLNQFPRLRGALTTLAFRKARSKSEEGAELYVNRETCADLQPALDRVEACSTLRHGVIALRPERFKCKDDLAGFLRHELTHLHDMVDPAFGYSPEIGSSGFNTAQQRLTRERYRLLWDITIDGRLTQQGRLQDGAREKHEVNFHRAYSFWPEEKRRAVFEELWANPAPHHTRLLALASDPKDLSHAQQPLPGAACPLCGFPTFDWAAQISFSPPVQERIVAEFPGWTAEHGACGRCAEIYQLLVKAQVRTTAVFDSQ
jgi:hypothetical protein